MRRRDRGKGDDGAVLVEFALVAPVLFLIIFGIIELGWGFGQYLDVRHGAREAARLAAVNYSDDGLSTGTAQTTQIRNQVCDRMGGDASNASVQIGLDDDLENEIGDRGYIVVESDLDTLTGFLDPVLDGVEINDRISFRLERDVEWDADEGPQPC